MRMKALGIIVVIVGLVWFWLQSRKNY